MLNHFFIQSALTQQRQRGQYRSLTTIDSGVTPTIQIGNQRFINFASNDYLGLASDPYLTKILAEAIQQIGQVGSGGSHLITGHSIWHEKLAHTLSCATGYEKTLTFSTGYMANVGVIQALANKDTVIFSDKLNHASIIDGAILSRAKVVRFTHRNYEQLDSLLQQNPVAKKLIVTDHVFSMDGTLADLTKLYDLAQRYECAIMVDDAHGFGLPYQAYRHQPPLADIYVGTFGKAIGTSGAFVAGSEALIEYLVNFARSFIYTTAILPIVASVTEQAVKLSLNDTDRSDKLLSNIRKLADGLTAQGWTVGIDDMPCQTAIIPVLIGDNDKTIELANRLKSHGFWVSAIRPPTVPVGTGRLRFCVSSTHTTEHIERLLAVMQSLLLI